MRKISKTKITVIWLFLSLFVGFIVAFFIDEGIKPILRTIALANAENLATEKINFAIATEISQEKYSLDEIITFEKDDSGKINAVKTNIFIANRLKSAISATILDEILSITISELGIPLGTLTGMSIFSGRGPKIPVKVIPIGIVKTNLQSKFTNSGINQTLHQIILELSVNINVILPKETISTDVSTNIVISETIVVGTVPEYFADITIPINQN